MALYTRARRYASGGLAGLCIALGTLSGPAAAQLPEYRVQVDTIRGRITAGAGHPLPGAEVLVTMAPERLTRATMADSNGVYRIVFEQGTGDYLVYVRALGYQTVRRRVTRDSTESLFVIDARLREEVRELAEVTIETRPQPPERDQAVTPAPGTGAAERAIDGFPGALPPALQGDLAALAATVPGVAFANGGISSLGIPPDQNTVTLNGLAFSGGVLPRGMNSITRVSTSTYDPGRGGFGGVETSVSLVRGGALTTRRVSLAVEPTYLQASPAIGAGAGHTRQLVDANLAGDGTLIFERWFFNSGVRFTRSTAYSASVADAAPAALRALGISPDSVARLRSIAAMAGVLIPATSRAEQTTQGLTLAGRLDRPATQFGASTARTATWGVTGYLSFVQRPGLALGTMALPAFETRTESGRHAVQASYSRYLGRDQLVLNETRTGITAAWDRDHNGPPVPAGRVRVDSEFDDELGAARWLSFGGRSGAPLSNRSLTWQATNETHFYWRGRPAHRSKVYAEVRLDEFSDRATGADAGTFVFNSLADLEAHRPASFARTLQLPDRSAQRWTGVLALSDTWRRTTRFRVLYGARVEAFGFPSPQYNPAVDRTFALRTDRALTGLHLSPRAGFTWVYTRARRTGEGLRLGQLGQFYQAPRGVLRGGIGEFRARVDPRAAAEAAAATGLPGSTVRLLCIGDAVPVPEWPRYAAGDPAVPDRCSDADVSAFGDAAPHVRLFDRSFQPPRSWRANLSWSSVVLGMVVSADAIASLNLNQTSRVDTNFTGITRFLLGNEGDRPVFVPASAVVERSGVVGAAAARRVPEFGPVLVAKSDVRSYARQFTLTLRPDAQWYANRYVASVAYTFTRVRTLARGFDAPVFGNPAHAEWARGDFAPTHEFLLQAGAAGRLVTFTLFGKLASGAPFTPVLASDVNGDGLANDRAFIFDPASGAEPEIADALRVLMEHTPTRTRSCLVRQFGRPALRNSCEGPWTASLNAHLRPRPALLAKLRVPPRADISVSFANPLGGIDKLLHGSRLRGWGSAAAVDPVLYHVDGFDADARRFRYRVNPRFGEPRPGTAPITNPFRVTVEARINLAKPYPAQQLDRMLKPGRAGNPGERLSADAMMQRYAQTVPDVFEQIIAQSDSLLLAPTQHSALTAAQAVFRARVDSVWRELAEYLATLPDRYGTAEALGRQEHAIDAVWELSRMEAQRVLPEILTPLQLSMLPYPASMLFSAREPVRMRLFLP